MKVVCEYCDSYVEADESGKCPHCLAPLGSTVAAVQQQEKEEAAAAQEAADERAAEEAHEERVNTVITGIMGLASTLIGSAAATKVAESSNPHRERPDQRKHGKGNPPTHREGAFGGFGDDMHRGHGGPGGFGGGSGRPGGFGGPGGHGGPGGGRR